MRSERRRPSARVHRSDSGTVLRSQSANSAGSTPMRNMIRQESGPSGATTYQHAEAMKNPSPRPHCMSPAAFARAWLGQISATSDAPVPHSDPSANPVMKRSTRNEARSHEIAVRPVNSA